MHDLLRKLAQHLSGEEFFRGDPQSLETKSLTKLRRIAIVKGKEFSITPSVQKEHIIRVRTLITNCKALEVKNTIFKTLPKIRVLDLTGSIIQSIPDCIGSLIHPRFSLSIEKKYRRSLINRNIGILSVIDFFFRTKFRKNTKFVQN